MAPGDQAHAKGFFGTERIDLWWLPPLAQFVGFTTFVIYSMWAALQGVNYHYTGDGANYLSPFYSPCISTACHEGPLAGLIPAVIGGITISPAFYILWAPLGFRATCYYYRKMYYRAYFLSPPGCSVETPKRKYKGESSFPLILQNIHRYFVPFALLLIVFLAYDAYLSFRFAGGWGVGVGSIILTANVILLAGYTFGCHSLRHMFGGRLDCFTCPESTLARTQHKTWKFVTWFNKRHMLWAWISLGMVGFADLYVRLVAMGIWHDVRVI